jgi:acyl-CoA reductase-like NAD-dependent aldehyde dehydrogenase
MQYQLPTSVHTRDTNFSMRLSEHYSCGRVYMASNSFNSTIEQQLTTMGVHAPAMRSSGELAIDDDAQE